MLDELRDSLYTTAWFGLMTTVWFGWAQEAPVARLKIPLIVGSVVAVLVAVGFGVLTVLHWSDPTALEGRYERFGIVVGAEVVLAGAGAAALLLTGHGRWVAWWVALVVALHFVSLAWIFGGQSLAWLGVVEVLLLLVGALLVRGARAGSTPVWWDGPSSAWVGPIMGLTILVYAVVNAGVTLQRLTST